MNMKMKKAIYILVGINIIVAIISINDYGSFSLANNIASFILSIFWSIQVVWLVNYFRTHLVENIKEIGVWGYIWRAIVVSILAIVFAALLMVIFSYNTGYSVTPSVKYTVSMFILCYFWSILFTWLLFSKSRINQAKWFMYFLSANKV